jgi:all-trans-retinol 13,14-reductase
VNHYFDGGNYPVGGCRSIAETIVPFIKKNNGDVFINANVQEISIKNNKANGVILDNGDYISSNNVISSTGVVNTLSKLVKNHKSFNTNLLKTVTPTESYICLYIGLNNSYKELGLEDTNMWIYDDYNHDKNVDNSLKGISESFPVIYISFPSIKDPKWNEESPNKTTMEAITMSSINWYKEWEEKEWKNRGNKYEEFKKHLTNRILKVVYEQLPQIKDKIEYVELSTPLTVKNLANYKKGEMYGLEHGPDRFRQKWLKPKTPIKNLFLTGQDITTVGFTSALFSGLLTSSVILKKNLTKDL